MVRARCELGYLVLVCDGVTDVLTDAENAAFLGRTLSARGKAPVARLFERSRRVSHKARPSSVAPSIRALIDGAT